MITNISTNQGGPNSSWQKLVYDFDLKLFKHIEKGVCFLGIPLVFSGIEGTEGHIALLTFGLYRCMAP